MQNKNIFYALGVIAFLVFFYFFFLNAPREFPSGIIIKIEKGSSLRSVSLELKKVDIIRSRLAFEAFVIIFSGEKHVIGADYYFKEKLPVYIVARRISKGEHHLAPISVTIPEGFDTTQIADVFSSKLINFNKNRFVLLVKELEGKLFPDTYFFSIADTEQGVIKSMTANFEKKISAFRPEIEISGKSEKDITVMASLIEREAKGGADRGLISGILWKRISMGMPLQVDVAMETYKTKGLPKNPICNPGIASIKAAIHPESSSYLYYLHDKDGNIHYAKSFSEHRQNVLKYLK